MPPGAAPSCAARCRSPDVTGLNTARPATGRTRPRAAGSSTPRLQKGPIPSPLGSSKT
jgi:hypothetical protein